MATETDIEYIRPTEAPRDAFGHKIEEESITVAKSANRTTARWGEAGFHNLQGGARASGNVTSAHSLLKPADLDWDPEFASIVVNGKTVPDDIGRAVVRSDTKEAIAVGVGSFYKLIPHRLLADLADALCGVSKTALHYGNAGHKHNGARPFLQLKAEPRAIGKDARGCDVEVSDVITLMTGHDGKMQMLGTYGANIVVCDNTYAHALSAARARGVMIRHTAKGLDAVNEAIRLAEEAVRFDAKFDNAALSLMLTPFAEERMKQLAVALIPGDSTRAEASRQKLLDAWESSPGAAPGTAWGAAQAVTFYTSHDLSARESTDRAFNLATGDGRGSSIQKTAWWHLTTDEGAEALSHVEVRRAISA